MPKKKRKKKWRMPQRIWAAQLSGFNWQQKHLLAFIWSCKSRGCHCWNCRLAKRFHVTPRTIQRWLANLKHHELIAIGHADGPGRTLWPRYQALNPEKKLDLSPNPSDPEAVKRFLDHMERCRKAKAKASQGPPKWKPWKTNQANPA